MEECLDHSLGPPKIMHGVIQKCVVHTFLSHWYNYINCYPIAYLCFFGSVKHRIFSCPLTSHFCRVILDLAKKLPSSSSGTYIEDSNSYIDQSPFLTTSRNIELLANIINQVNIYLHHTVSPVGWCHQWGGVTSVVVSPVWCYHQSP